MGKYSYWYHSGVGGRYWVAAGIKKEKKGGPQNVEQFLHHLLEIGVKASLEEKGVDEEKVGVSRSFMRRSEGVIKIGGRYIDYILG